MVIDTPMPFSNGWASEKPRHLAKNPPVAGHFSVLADLGGRPRTSADAIAWLPEISVNVRDADGPGLGGAS